MFVVVVTGAPGTGKTVCLTALSDALAADRIRHAAVDVDELAWAYPYPDDEERRRCLRAVCDVHRARGHELLLVAEVVDSTAALGALLAAAGVAADGDRLLVRLEAKLETLRDRITLREAPGWHGLEWLLEHTEPWRVALGALDGVDLSLDTERHSPDEVAARIRAARPDLLLPG